MNTSKDSLAFWASIVGTVIAVLGLVRSRAWLIGFGVLLFLVSVGAVLYARRQRQLLLSAAIKVDGRSIDALNIASLRRRLNRSLVIQEAHHLAEIDGEDLSITWQYSGYCRAACETAIEFSIDTDNNIPFENLRCFGYDLGHDPHRKHPIRPILIGPEGLSKKIALPFLEPLTAQHPFSVLLTCELPGCMKGGWEYYTSTMSFDQERVNRYATRLVFRHGAPFWLRVYDCDDLGGVRLLRDLRPARATDDLSEYLDAAEGVPARSARIYVFERARPLGRSLQARSQRAA
jgi:hypothetical protein